MNRIPVKSSLPARGSQIVRRFAARGVTPGRMEMPELPAPMSNLEVHHREFRSQSGDDAEQNLVTLCAACHSIVHRELDANCFADGTLC